MARQVLGSHRSPNVRAMMNETVNEGNQFEVALLLVTLVGQFIVQAYHPYMRSRSMLNFSSDHRLVMIFCPILA
jgi:hypothetical protein